VWQPDQRGRDFGLLVEFVRQALGGGNRLLKRRSLMPDAAGTILGIPDLIAVFAHEFQPFATQFSLYPALYGATQQEQLCVAVYGLWLKERGEQMAPSRQSKTRLCKKEWTVLHCGIENAAMHLLKPRRHNYVDRQTLQKTSCNVRRPGETDP
jgi:hypothetical protein